MFSSIILPVCFGILQVVVQWEMLPVFHITQRIEYPFEHFLDVSLAVDPFELPLFLVEIHHRFRFLLEEFDAFFDRFGIVVGPLIQLPTAMVADLFLLRRIVGHMEYRVAFTA